MRCNQVSILIERFGEYVPEEYPADVQRISVYCDDSGSIYAALSKAYAMAVNELNEYEEIGRRTDVSTNEFSYVDYREMHGTIPKERRSYDQDLDWQYGNTRLLLLKDYVWVYENSSEIIEVIKNAGKDDFVPALKEHFGLDDVQVRKLSQIRMDMLDKDSYEKIKQEIDELEKKMADARENAYTKEDEVFWWKREIQKREYEIDVLNAYFTAAEHYEDILRVMRDSEEPKEYMDYMKETYGFSYEQARAIRYAPADYYSRQEHKKQEERLKKLQEEIAMYKRWVEEIRESEENGQS